MGTAAELGRVVADLDDAHLVPVLLAEQHHRAELARLFDRRHERAHGDRLEHALVDDALDALALFGRQLLGVREVEAQLVGANGRARLLDVIAEHVAQRLVQQVRRGVVRLGREAVAPVDDCLHARSRRQERTSSELDDQDLVVTELEDVDDLQPRRLTVHEKVAPVADLAATCGVERTLLELDELARPLQRRRLDHGGEDVRLGVADELRRPLAGSNELCRNLLRRVFASAARHFAVLLHQVVEPVQVERLAALLGELLRELDREAVRGDERERILGGDRLLAGQFLEHLHAARERLGELLLLRAHDPLDLAGVLAQDRIRVAHLVDDDRGQAVDAFQADALRLVDRPAQEAAADVAAALVGRLDSLRDQERDGTAVVCEHAVRALRHLGVSVGDARLALDPVHDHAEAVGVEDRAHALQHACRALDAVARVDIRRRQRHEHVARLQVVRHEDEVVDLHDAVAVAGPAVRVAAGVGLAAVVEDLGALPARARLARLPEVVLAEPHDALGGDADTLPRVDRDGVLLQLQHRVALVHGRPQSLRLELQHAGHPLPREVDGLVLVVVAEREVAHHLEEGAVAVGAPDLVEVVVLAARAQARLDADDTVARRLFRAQEIRLELLHTGDDEERRLVLRRRDQRVPGHAQMAPLLVEALEGLAQLVRRHRHGRTVYGRPVERLLQAVRSGSSSSAAISSLIFSSARRISRETCICEMPTCCAI